MNRSTCLGFDTQVCYTICEVTGNRKQWHINEYTDYHKNKYCINDHELEYVWRGKKATSYFRHKNHMPTTQWHLDWQNKYLITERTIGNRRADAVLDEQRIVIEFQHSRIPDTEVIGRNRNYNEHDYTVLWIIDGSDIKCKDNTLDFKKATWKYESFMSCRIIMIDGAGMLYTVYPNKVRGDMYTSYSPISVNEFIKGNTYNALKYSFVETYEPRLPKQCKLYVKQQGAGNGKTWGLLKNLESELFDPYNTFIIITKQHAAKAVIDGELKDMQKKGHLIMLDKYELTRDGDKKFIYKYNYNGKTRTIIICTVDSFVHCVADKSQDKLKSSIDMFESLLMTINSNEVTPALKSSSINMSGLSIKLNKKTCIVCDETQDLSIDYAKALLRIMELRYVSAYVVGDKLQSISKLRKSENDIHENAFVYLQHVNNIGSNIVYDIIEAHHEPPSNKVRRFSNPVLIEFVNEMVRFDKFKLPAITTDVESPANQNMLQFIPYEFNPKYLNSIATEFMQYYKEEADKSELKVNDDGQLKFEPGPKNFMVITPFTKRNELINCITEAINEYWIDRYADKRDKYERYAIFHKSEQGTSINLKESDEATRIVSIHSSKGDGRPIVFAVGISEGALVQFCEDTDSLIYESLLHVSLTRMKEKLYFMYQNNGDNICQRVQNYCCKRGIAEVEPKNIYITKRNKITGLAKYDKLYSHIDRNIFDKMAEMEPVRDSKDKMLLDSGNHYIRYASALMKLRIKSLKYGYQHHITDEKGRQYSAMLLKMRKYECKKYDDWKLYNNALGKNYYMSPSKSIPVYSAPDSIYSEYSNKLFTIIESLQAKLASIYNIKNLCPIESVVLLYMEEVTEHGVKSDIRIWDIYEIFNTYDKAFSHKFGDHEHCLCKQLFKDNLLFKTESDSMVEYDEQSYRQPDKSDECKLQQYLHVHYEKISALDKSFKKFSKKYTDIKWFLGDYSLNGATNDFEIRQRFNMIGHNDEYTFVIYIQPQFSTINYNKVLFESVIDNVLIKGLDNGKVNSIIEEFGNRKIINVVFTLDSNDYYEYRYFDENGDDLLDIDDGHTKQLVIRSIIDGLQHKYNGYNNILYTYFKYHNTHKSSILQAAIRLKKVCGAAIPPYLLKLLNCGEDILLDYEKLCTESNKLINQAIDRYIGMTNYK